MKQQEERKAWFRPVILTAAFCIGLGTGMQAHNGMAEETAGDDGYTPTFANPAQAQHAANIAEAVAAEPDAATLDALSAVEDAEAALREAEEAGNQQEIDAARLRLAEAEQAYAEVIEARIGVITSEIEAMRDADMGWGEIARELGVHPSVLGLGHTKAYRNKYGWSDEGTADDEAGDEVAEATERNVRTGWSQGHGLGLNAGVKDTAGVQGGYALGRVNKEKKAGGGISGAAGLSGGGQGNAGGSGNGNSGGGKAGSGAGSSVGSDGGPGKSDKGKSQGGGSGKSKGNSGGKGNSGK
jgi:hypothetical protein